MYPVLKICDQTTFETADLDKFQFAISIQGKGSYPISANLFVANLTQILYKYGACLEAMQPTRTGIYCYRFFHRIG